MSTYYLRLEGVNLDHFVFDTNSLSVVRGGGLLLLDATDRVGKAGLGLAPVTTGASAGLFAFGADDDRQAAKKRREVDTLLKADPQLRHATFVVDVVPASGSFADDREKLLALNRWRQMQAPSVAPPAPPGQDHGPCRIDGVRPAGGRTIPKGEKDRAASDSVFTRWTHGVGQKQAFYRQHAQADPKLRFAAEFETLTDDPGRGNLHRKMAVIYADGNGFGKLQAENCQTRQAQEKFDTDIKDLRARLLRALVAEAAKKPGFLTAKGEIRLETLLWGGDEILWVVPAWMGWWTVEFFFARVTPSEGWRLFGTDLTHAAGVVFCHHSAPIHRVKGLAKALAEIVKESPGGRSENRFAYQVLESFDHVGRDLATFRRERWPRPDELVLKGDGLDAVSKAFRDLVEEEFPRTQLHAIVKALVREALANPAAPPSEEVTTRIERACKGRPKSQAALAALGSHFSGAYGSAVKWLHIAELWDYVAAE